MLVKKSRRKFFFHMVTFIAKGIFWDADIHYKKIWGMVTFIRKHFWKCDFHYKKYYLGMVTYITKHFLGW